MYLEQLDHAFTKCNLKRMIKIVEIQKSILKRQNKFQNIYTKYFHIHKHWNKICAEELKMELKMEIMDEKLKIDNLAKYESNYGDEHLKENETETLNNNKKSTVTDKENFNFEVDDIIAKDRVINDIANFTPEVINKNTLENEQEKNEEAKIEKENITLVIEKFKENIKSLIKEIEDSIIDMNILNDQKINEEKLSDGYNFIMIEKRNKLNSLQQELSAKYSEEIKIMKILEGLTKESTNKNYRKNVEAVLNRFYNIENESEEETNLDDYFGMSQLYWSIENIENNRLQTLFELFDSTQEKNEIINEIWEKRDFVNYLEILDHFKENVIIEDQEIFENNEEESIDSVDNARLESMSKDVKIKSDELKIELTQPAGKQINPAQITATVARYYSFDKSKTLKLQSELNFEEHLQKSKPTEIKIKKNYSCPSYSFDKYLLKQGSPPKNTDTFFTGKTILEKRKSVDSGMGFFFSEDEVDINENKDSNQYITEELIQNERRKTKFSSYTNEVYEKKGDKIIPVAAVRPLVQVTLNEREETFDLKNNSSTEHVEQKNHAKSKSKNIKTKSNVSKTKPELTEKNSDYPKTIPSKPLLTKTNSNHRKLCRIVKNSLTEEDKSKITKSLSCEKVVHTNEEIAKRKTQSLPTHFQMEGPSPFINFQSIHIDGELLKIADFKLGDKNRLSIRSQPRKLSFKRRDSGRKFVFAR